MTNLETTKTTVGRERSISTRFLFTDPSLERVEYGDTYRPALDITTSHDKNRKALVTSITRVWVGPVMVRYAIDFNQGDEPPVNAYTGQAIARYSDKALEDRHGVIMSNVAAVGIWSPLLEWATRAKFL